MTTVHEHLEAFRVSIANCRLALFVDLGAELTLSCSATRKPAQEELDALAATAVLALPEADGSADEALLLSPGRALMFVRSPNERTEALCCICDPMQDVADLRAGAQATLIRIGAGD